MGITSPEMELGKACLDDGLRVYAVGDIHGALDELKSLCALIAADQITHPVDDVRIIFLGDYLDRGPHSKGVVSWLMALMARDERVICLRGNHDDALLAFLDDAARVASGFMRNGGAETLASYGIRSSGTKNIDHVEGAARLLVNRSHIEFLRALPYSVNFGDYFFCHAGIRPGVALEDQAVRDLTWIREEFLDYRGLLPKVVVHGHTSHPSVEVRPHRINVDTRVLETGTLTCVVLEGTGYRFLQTGAAMVSGDR